MQDNRCSSLPPTTYHPTPRYLAPDIYHLTSTIYHPTPRYLAPDIYHLTGWISSREVGVPDTSIPSTTYHLTGWIGMQRGGSS